MWFGYEVDDLQQSFLIVEARFVPSLYIKHLIKQPDISVKKYDKLTGMIQICFPSLPTLIKIPFLAHNLFVFYYWRMVLRAGNYEPSLCSTAGSCAKLS